MAQYKEYEVVGKIIPINNGTRLRSAPSTYTQVLGSYPKDAQVVIDLIREYTETVTSEYTKSGDKWGRVVSINGVQITQPAWMAVTYLGVAICTPDYLISPLPSPAPPVERPKIVSLSVTTYYDDGTSITEKFVRDDV